MGLTHVCRGSVGSLRRNGWRQRMGRGGEHLVVVVVMVGDSELGRSSEHLSSSSSTGSSCGSEWAEAVSTY